MTGIVHDENWIAELPAPVRGALLDRTTVCSVETGETLKVAGDKPDAIYHIERGYLKLMGLYPDGRNMLIEIYRAGNSFGETAVIVRRDHHFHSTVALVPTTVRRLARDDFWALYRSHPEIPEALARKFANKITRMFDSREIKATRRLRSQIANLLLNIAHHCGTPAPDGSLWSALPISHNDIAEYLDVTRQAVQREISALRRAGLVLQTKGGWTILQPESLAHI